MHSHSPVSPSALLTNAALLFAERGVCQGNFCDDPAGIDGPVCTVGAINVAAGVPAWDLMGARARGAGRAYLVLADHLGLLDDDEDASFPPAMDVISLISAWSDAPGRTREDVSRALITAGTDPS